MKPPRVVWYMVSKESISRLQDEVARETADRRLEFLFGLSGLAIGSIKDVWETMINVIEEKPITPLDIGFCGLFAIAVVGVIYFWRIKSDHGNTAKILDEIKRESSETHTIYRPNNKSGVSYTGPPGSVSP